MGLLLHLIAAVTISGFVLSVPGSASPIIQAPVNTALMPELSEGFVQKVHGSHCRGRKGIYRGKRQWHRHRKACRGYDYSHRNDRRYPPRPYYGYGEFGFHYDEWQWERRNWLWD